MFFGQYEHSIDEKGRMTIPARYRELMADGAYITQGFDQNLMVLTLPVFEQIVQRINETSITDPLARQLKRLIFANADQVVLDKAGRILLPTFLRDSAHLGNSIVVVGNGAYFEIWSQERWLEQSAGVTRS